MVNKIVGIEMNQEIEKMNLPQAGGFAEVAGSGFQPGGSIEPEADSVMNTGLFLQARRFPGPQYTGAPFCPATVIRFTVT
jgi:hypothetical protein